MEKNFDKFYEKDITFVLFTILTILIGIASTVLSIVNDNVSYVLVPIITIIAFVLFRSYKTHNKNVMKGLMGAVLMWLVTEEVSYMINVFLSGPVAFKNTVDNLYGLFVVVKVVCVIVTLGIFALHFVINSDHKSNPLFIELNQTLQLFLICLYVADIIISAMAMGSLNAELIAFLVFKAALMNMVICIESKLDAYRIIREAKGWTEKK